MTDTTIFLQKAKENTPKLTRRVSRKFTPVSPIGDDSCYQCTTVRKLPETRRVFGNGDSIMLDLGHHTVGYFSFRMSVHELFPDAPVRIYVKFAETPYEKIRCKKIRKTSFRASPFDKKAPV